MDIEQLLNQQILESLKRTVSVLLQQRDHALALLESVQGEEVVEQQRVAFDAQLSRILSGEE